MQGLRQLARLAWRWYRHLRHPGAGLWRGLALRDPAPGAWPPGLGPLDEEALAFPLTAEETEVWRTRLASRAYDWVLYQPPGQPPVVGMRFLLACAIKSVRGPGFVTLPGKSWLADPLSVRRALDRVAELSDLPAPLALARVTGAAAKRPPGAPRIHYMLPGTGLSGGTAICIQHARRLRARGLEVTLVDVHGHGEGLDWFPDFDIPLVPLHLAPAWPDAVVATGWQTTAFLDVFSGAVPVYFVQSDETRFTEDPRLKKRIAATYRRQARYMTEARWIQDWLRQNFGHEALLVPNGLDPDIIRPDLPLAPPGPRPRILLEGPIAIPFKGMAEAFEAVGPLDAEIWCVSSHGEPGPGQRCDRFFGKVPMQEMRRIYSSCDIFLKLSRVEGFFGPPLEMMACGAGAVVVGAVTGHEEYIRHEGNALVVPLGDVPAARAAVQRLIDDKALRQRLVTAGLRTAAEWPWEATIETLDNWFRDLTGKDSVQPPDNTPPDKLKNNLA